MRQRVAFIGLAVWLGLLGRAPSARGEAAVPAAIEAALKAAGVAEGELATAYEAVVTALSTNVTYLSTVKPAMDVSARADTIRTALGWSGPVQRYVVETIPKLKQIADIGSRTRDGRSLLELLGRGSSWPKVVRGARGFVSLPALLVVTTAVVFGTQGYLAGKAYLKQEDLRAQAADEAALANLAGMVAGSMRAGRARLLPGMTLEQAIQRVEQNLQAGLPPFADVVEARPCPDISGAWEGDLVVKEVRGQTAIPVGQKRSAKGNSFVLQQDHNFVTLQFRKQRISGYFQPQMVDRLASGAGGDTSITMVETILLDEGAEGGIARVQLRYHYGAGAGSLAGRLGVELEQREPTGAVITSGGMLTRQR